MTIKLVLPEQEADFIRHARSETLRSIGEEPTAAVIEPSHFGMYFIAYDEENGNQPIAMAEVAFLDQVYDSFADSPYPTSLNLDQFCPLEKMSGIRTIFVEPEFRHRSGSLYLQLILAATLTCRDLGARFATATTNADNAYLNRLYAKTGGRPLERIRMEHLVECDVAPWVFNLQELLNLKLMKRASSSATIEVDPQIARTLRARSVRDLELQCA